MKTKSDIEDLVRSLFPTAKIKVDVVNTTPPIYHIISVCLGRGRLVRFTLCCYKSRWALGQGFTDKCSIIWGDQLRSAIYIFCEGEFSGKAKLLRRRLRTVEGDLSSLRHMGRYTLAAALERNRKDS